MLCIGWSFTKLNLVVMSSSFITTVHVMVVGKMAGSRKFLVLILFFVMLLH